MSVSPTVSRLKRNYEKLVLLVVLLALIASVGALVRRITAGRSMIDAARGVVQSGPDQVLKPVDMSRMEARMETIRSPFQAPDVPRRTFISEVRKSCIKCYKAIPVDATKCTFCGAAGQLGDFGDRDHDGIPDAVETQFGLNPLDPSDARKDLDLDGFTNLEEFAAGTKLNDAKDTPPIEAKIRVDGVRQVSFFLRFNGVQELVKGETRFQLNLRTGDRTYFLKLGDTVEGCTLQAYDAKSNTLTLKKGDREIRLERGKNVNDDELYVVFVLMTDGSTISTKASQTFKLANKEYRVESVLAGQVRIRPLAGESKEILVAKLTPEERASLAELRRRGAIQDQGTPPAPGPGTREGTKNR